MDNEGKNKLRGLSLFSGIGGIEIGLSEWVETKAYCEIEKYPQAVLRSRFGAIPYTENDTKDRTEKPILYSDITKLTGEQIVKDCGRIDIIMGGFPCQDISNAGKRKGIKAERSGLWFEMQRLIGEIQPRYVFVENVSAIINRGLDIVLGTLSEIGYDAVWTTLRASDVGAPHRRERWFMLAFPDEAGRKKDLENASEGIPICSISEGLNAGSMEIPNPNKQRWLAFPNVGDPQGSSQQGRTLRQGQEQFGRAGSPEGAIPYTSKQGLEGQEPKGKLSAREQGLPAKCGFWETDPADLPDHSKALTDLGRIPDGISEELDTYLNTQTHKSVLDRYGRENKDPKKELPILWEALGAKTYGWQVGGLYSIQAEEILRQVVNNRESEYSSQGQRQNEQFYRELDDIVCFLSYEMALDEWQDYIERILGLSNLWQVIRQDEMRDVPKTLSEVQEIWQSKSHKEKMWFILCVSGGLGDRVWFYTPRVTEQKKHRVERLKCLGNAVVPQQAREAFVRLIKLKLRLFSL